MYEYAVQRVGCHLRIALQETLCSGHGCCENMPYYYILVLLLFLFQWLSSALAMLIGVGSAQHNIYYKMLKIYVLPTRVKVKITAPYIADQNQKYQGMGI